MAARKGENLPSVDSLGELVAFQGPPKLTALDISPLHIPLDHFHQHRLSDVTRGALRGTEKAATGQNTPPLAPGTRAWKKLELSLARATSISLFCCHSSVDRFEVSRRFTKQLIGPSRDMALNQRQGITCRLIARAYRGSPASRKSAVFVSRARRVVRASIAFSSDRPPNICHAS